VRESIESFIKKECSYHRPIGDGPFICLAEGGGRRKQSGLENRYRRKAITLGAVDPAVYF